MNRKHVFTIVMMSILVVVLSACSVPAAAPATQPTPRTLSVNGNAQAAITPDIAYINIGVHS